MHDSVTPTTAIHNINLAWLRRDCDARITTPELALLGVYQGSRVGSTNVYDELFRLIGMIAMSISVLINKKGKRAMTMRDARQQHAINIMGTFKVSATDNGAEQNQHGACSCIATMV